MNQTLVFSHSVEALHHSFVCKPFFDQHVHPRAIAFTHWLVVEFLGQLHLNIQTGCEFPEVFEPCPISGQTAQLVEVEGEDVAIQAHLNEESLIRVCHELTGGALKSPMALHKVNLGSQAVAGKVSHAKTLISLTQQSPLSCYASVNTQQWQGLVVESMHHVDKIFWCEDH